jgi:hypothetical protein
VCAFLAARPLLGFQSFLTPVTLEHALLEKGLACLVATVLGDFCFVVCGGPIFPPVLFEGVGELVTLPFNLLQLGLSFLEFSLQVSDFDSQVVYFP